MNELAPKRHHAARCPACQLQLCKSRESLPHAALKVADSSIVSYDKLDKSHHALYMCENCTAVLVHSLDIRESGWRQFK
jgi:hypothetical protein